jgi:hypothetical protein
MPEWRFSSGKRMVVYGPNGLRERRIRAPCGSGASSLTVCKVTMTPRRQCELIPSLPWRHVLHTAGDGTVQHAERDLTYRSVLSV